MYLKGCVEGYEAQNDTQDEAFPENVVELFTWSEYLAKTTEELITWSEYLTEKGADPTKEETKEVNTVIPNDELLKGESRHTQRRATRGEYRQARRRAHD